MKELVSVIIPVYQAKKHLADCLESVLGQTYKKTEIILVDDGSDDGSQIMCDIYASKYDNIRCIHQKNQGVSCARNTGLELANGEYVLFVDSDDYIAPDYLEKAVATFVNSEIDLYLCGYQNVRKGGKIKEEKKYPSIKEGIWNRKNMAGVTLSLFKTNVLHAIGTKIYRRDIIENKELRFCENKSYYEDIYFCLSYLYYCKKIFVQNEVLYFYQRDIENSLSKQTANIDLENIYCTYKLLAKIIKIKSLKEEDKKTFYNLYIDKINSSFDAVICAEGRYNNCVYKMYKQLAKDRIYNNAIKYKYESDKWEHLFIKTHLYFLAYLFRYVKK